MKHLDMSKQIESRLAKLTDLGIITPIIFACASRLKDQNLPDWSEYHTVERLEEEAEDPDGLYIYFRQC